ncbi:MAG: NAD-dependent epimerase/dehydratase family protein, partial [Bacteroidetes bacterium]
MKPEAGRGRRTPIPTKRHAEHRPARRPRRRRPGGNAEAVFSPIKKMRPAGHVAPGGQVLGKKKDMSVILIAGGTGLVGMHLSRILVEKGHQVRHLSRRPRPAAAFPAYAWNPEKGTIDAAAFSGVDYVVNLAGANLAEKRWTPAQKRRIIESRTQSSRLLGESIAALN